MTGADALADFAATHRSALTRFAYLLCGDRGLAEDLVQDAFLALYRRFGEHAAARGTRRLRPAHDRQRAHLAPAPPRLVGDRCSATSPDRAGDGAGRAASRTRCGGRCATLPERQRAVLVLRYYLDLPDDEIAARPRLPAPAPSAASPPAPSRRCAPIRDLVRTEDVR